MTTRPADSAAPHDGSGHRSIDGYCIEPACAIHAANPRTADSAAPEPDLDRLFAEAGTKVRADLAARCVDLMTAVELADTRATAIEEKDGMVEVYGLRASDWNRIVAVARGHMSKKTRRSLDAFLERLTR